jgi:two-component system nitrogen regulation sensor histidine kinase GlnL
VTRLTRPAELKDTEFAGLDLAATAILVVSNDARIMFANAALETLVNTSRRALIGLSLEEATLSGELLPLFHQAHIRAFDERRQDMTLEVHGREPANVQVIVVALEEPGLGALFEFREVDAQLKVDREERLMEQGQANRELVRNLAHEIKNPLGGIRGAAQLLELEVSGDERGNELREFTQVIIKEADRLQTLVDRFLAPHRKPQLVSEVNIHEVCERVRAVLLAEFPHGLHIKRDYDISIPDFRGDKEQLIQALLNIAHNAAHALKDLMAHGEARIVLRTRVLRNLTIAKQRSRLALDLHVVDNGPGIPEVLRERIFYPLVSGREGGTGLGLTLAQTFVQQHKGVIECESKPGLTDFRILIPLS